MRGEGEGERRRGGESERGGGGEGGSGREFSTRKDGEASSCV